MATIDSLSTTTEIRDAYFDNCGYFEDASTAKAKAFVTVCEAMQARGVTKLRNGEEELTFSMESLTAAINRAYTFIATNRPTTDSAYRVLSSVDIRC